MSLEELELKATEDQLPTIKSELSSFYSPVSSQIRGKRVLALQVNYYFLKNKEGSREAVIWGACAPQVCSLYAYASLFLTTTPPYVLGRVRTQGHGRSIPHYIYIKSELSSFYFPVSGQTRGKRVLALQVSYYFLRDKEESRGAVIWGACAPQVCSLSLP